MGLPTHRPSCEFLAVDEGPFGVIYQPDVARPRPRAALRVAVRRGDLALRHCPRERASALTGRAPDGLTAMHGCRL